MPTEKKKRKCKKYGILLLQKSPKIYTNMKVIKKELPYKGVEETSTRNFMPPIKHSVSGMCYILLSHWSKGSHQF